MTHLIRKFLKKCLLQSKHRTSAENEVHDSWICLLKPVCRSSHDAQQLKPAQMRDHLFFFLPTLVDVNMTTRASVLAQVYVHSDLALATKCEPVNRLKKKKRSEWMCHNLVVRIDKEPDWVWWSQLRHDYSALFTMKCGLCLFTKRIWNTWGTRKQEEPRNVERCGQLLEMGALLLNKGVHVT